MKAANRKFTSALRWEIIQRHDRYFLCAVGGFNLAIIWDDGGGDIYTIRTYSGADAADDAMCDWWDLIEK